MPNGQGEMRAPSGANEDCPMIKRFDGGGPLNIPFSCSVVNGRPCDHLHLARAAAEACAVEREHCRAPVIPITRARARREGR